MLGEKAPEVKNKFLEWLKANNWLFFVLLFLTGCFTCFLGQKLFKPVLMITIVVFTTFFGLWLCYATFLSKNEEDWLVWTLFACFIVAGFILGVCAIKCLGIAIFFVAGFAGVCLGITVWDGCLSIFSPSVVAMWIFVAVFALIFACCVAWREQEILIVATAFAGAFMIGRSLGLVLPGYSIDGKVSLYYWVYLLIMAAVTCMGIAVQLKLKQRDERNSHPYQRIRQKR